MLIFDSSRLGTVSTHKEPYKIIIINVERSPVFVHSSHLHQKESTLQPASDPGVWTQLMEIVEVFPYKDPQKTRSLATWRGKQVWGFVREESNSPESPRGALVAKGTTTRIVWRPLGRMMWLVYSRQHTHTHALLCALAAVMDIIYSIIRFV